MTDDWAKKARERCEAASPGPWEDRGEDGVPGVITAWCADYGGDYGPDVSPEDMALICHARDDLPRALDCVEAADRLAKTVAEMATDHHSYRDLPDAPGHWYCHCITCEIADLLADYRKVRDA